MGHLNKLFHKETYNYILRNLSLETINKDQESLTNLIEKRIPELAFEEQQRTVLKNRIDINTLRRVIVDDSIPDSVQDLEKGYSTGRSSMILEVSVAGMKELIPELRTILLHDSSLDCRSSAFTALKSLGAPDQVFIDYFEATSYSINPKLQKLRAYNLSDLANSEIKGLEKYFWEVGEYYVNRLKESLHSKNPKRRDNIFEMYNRIMNITESFFEYNSEASSEFIGYYANDKDVGYGIHKAVKDLVALGAVTGETWNNLGAFTRYVDIQALAAKNATWQINPKPGGLYVIQRDNGDEHFIPFNRETEFVETALDGIENIEF
ncbi:hypothetical protein HQ533_03560 [Candidatus Woesearchaeota archaeon]|nr:hypothetical protein [Candidatus Woesearchaeota archaeon]